MEKFYTSAFTFFYFFEFICIDFIFLVLGVVLLNFVYVSQAGAYWPAGVPVPTPVRFFKKSMISRPWIMKMRPCGAFYGQRVRYLPTPDRLLDVSPPQRKCDVFNGCRKWLGLTLTDHEDKHLYEWKTCEYICDRYVRTLYKCGRINMEMNISLPGFYFLSYE